MRRLNKRDWKDISNDRTKHHAFQLQKMGEKYRQNQEILKVILARPEILTMALRRGEIITLTLNKAPEDPDEFCKWLLNAINMNLGGV